MGLKKRGPQLNRNTSYLRRPSSTSSQQSDDSNYSRRNSSGDGGINIISPNLEILDLNNKIKSLQTDIREIKKAEYDKNCKEANSNNSNSLKNNDPLQRKVSISNEVTVLTENSPLKE